MEYYSTLKRKEILSCYNKDEPWEQYGKWNKTGHRKTDTLWYHYIE